MKQKLFIFILMTLFLPVMASAESEKVTVNGYNYTIITDDYYAYVTGGASGSTVISIPSSITYKNQSYTVVGVDDMAFWSRDEVTSVSLPSTLRWIGKEAFLGCNMTSLIIPNSVNTIQTGAFASCKALLSLSLPSKAITIQRQAFRNCISLTSVSIFAGSDLQGEVFENCTSLTNVVIPKNATLGGQDFAGCTGLTKVVIWSSDTGEYTFNGCTSLTTISFGSTARNIDKYCFSGCTGLTSVVIPNQIETIGDGAFQDCSNLESITLGSGLKKLGQINTQAGIVSGCTNLSKVIIHDVASWCNVDLVHGVDIFQYGKLYSDENTEVTKLVIPEGVTTIKKYAFRQCSNIQSVQFPNTLEAVGDYTFYKCAALESVKFGSGLKTIGAYAFGSCSLFTKMIIPDVAAYCGITLDGNSNLFAYDKHIYSDEETEITELIIPEGTAAINENVFRKCIGITSLTIPSSVETIGTYAFAECEALVEIVIGDHVSSIGDNAFFTFYNCGRLTADVYCLATTPPSAAKITTSSGFSRKKLHVPGNSLELYKEEAGWKAFSSIVALQDGDPGYDDLVGAVTLKAKSYSRVYGDANPTFEFEVIKGTIASGSPVITCEATATSPVGTYDIVIEKGDIDNAKVYLMNGTLTVTPAPLTISAGNYVKVQGEENPAFTPIYSGFKNKETEEVLTKKPVLSTTASVTSPVGSYPVTVSGAEAANYSITYKAGTLTVTSAAEAFEIYKSELISKTDACILIINAAKEAINALSYDELKTLKENKAGADALVNKLAHDLATKLESIGDVNGDGDIDIADAVHIVNYVVGKISALAPRFGWTLPEPE